MRGLRCASASRRPRPTVSLSDCGAVPPRWSGGRCAGPWRNGPQKGRRTFQKDRKRSKPATGIRPGQVQQSETAQNNRPRLRSSASTPEDRRAQPSAFGAAAGGQVKGEARACCRDDDGVQAQPSADYEPDAGTCAPRSQPIDASASAVVQAGPCGCSRLRRPPSSRRARSFGSSLPFRFGAAPSTKRSRP